MYATKNIKRNCTYLMRGSFDVAVLNLVRGVVSSDVEWKLDFEHFPVFVPKDSSVKAEKGRFGIENHALRHFRSCRKSKLETNWNGGIRPLLANAIWNGRKRRHESKQTKEKYSRPRNDLF